jgi:hypothetical protein
VAIICLPLQRVTQHLVGLSKSLGMESIGSSPVGQHSTHQVHSTNSVTREQCKRNKNLELLGSLGIVRVLIRVHLPRLKKEMEQDELENKN